MPLSKSGNADVEYCDGMTETLINICHSFQFEVKALHRSSLQRQGDEPEKDCLGTERAGDFERRVVSAAIKSRSTWN
jgi:hypothetical protein